MFKMLGLVGLVISAGLMGIMKAETLKERIRLLEDFQKMLLDLKSQMNYFREPLPVIFRKTGQKGHTAAFRLLDGVLNDLEKKDAEIGEIWVQNASAAYRMTPVTAEDLQIIKGVGLFIGQSDYDNQLMQFDWLEEQIALQLKDARNTYRQKGSMYRRIGFFSGGLAALVLL